MRLLGMLLAEAGSEGNRPDGSEGDGLDGDCLSKPCLLPATARGRVTPVAVDAGLPFLAASEDCTGLLRVTALTGRLPARSTQASV